MNTFYAYQWDTAYTVTVPWDEDTTPYMDFVRRWADDSRGTITPTLSDGALTAICPPELLIAPGEIAVYLRDENTRRQAASIVVQPRAKPDDYVYTPVERWTAEKAVDKALQAAHDSGMFTGPTGPVGPQGPKGDTYKLTDSDKAEIAVLVENATIVQAPQYVDSVAKMTDTGKVYVLASTGELWAYMDTTTTGTVREDIDAGVIANSRLGSDGSIATDSAYAGYVATSNYIDLTAYPIPFTLHLEGADFLPEGNISYTRMATYDANKTKIACGAHYQVYGGTNGRHAYLNITKDDIVVDDNGDAHFTFNQAVKTNTDAAMQYVRVSGAGTDTNAVKVYATYTGTITGGQWVSTGTSYAPALSADDKAAIAGDVAAMIDTQLLSVIGEGTVTV